MAHSVYTQEQNNSTLCLEKRPTCDLL